MVSDFPNPASLPGGAKRGQQSDMSTYYNLWKVAENVIERCVQGRGEMGWQATGMEQSLLPSVDHSHDLLSSMYSHCSRSACCVKTWEVMADTFILAFLIETGYRYSIGVFIWSTGSEEDELIEADEPRFTFPAPKALVNGSAADG